jgi:hypothetical protein
LFSFNANPLKELVEGHCANLESLSVAGLPLQAEISIPPQITASDQVQHHVLGLDECLMASLENEYAFGGCLGLPDAVGSRSECEPGTPSDHSEGLSSAEGSSASLDASPDCRERSGREPEDIEGQDMTNGFIEEMLREDFN